MSTSAITPMNVVGVEHLVERAYRESGALQYLRELLVNATEAGATRVEFGPEWAAVETQKVYRLMVADNGKGMGAEELLKFLNTFGGGGKPIGDAHENFGVGAKTSLLPWNHAGVVVLSWTSGDAGGAMVWLQRDAKTGEYGARKFETPDGYHEVVAPFDEWSKVKPAWIVEHGTVVVCLGNTEREDTFLGKGGDGDTKGIASYLNRRLWEVPEGTEIYVQELRSQKREAWPCSLAEAEGNGDRRYNRRRVRGARYFVETAEGKEGKLGETGSVKLDDGTRIDWYLWEGQRPKVHSHAEEKGYIAAIYRNEVYDAQKHVSQFRSFGITHGAVRDNLTLIAWPPCSGKDEYGVYPDTARNALKIQGSKRAGEPLPWAEWAQEFADNLPDAIASALTKAGPATSATLADDKWRERLVDRFGARWKTLRYVPSTSGALRIHPDTPGSGSSSGGGGTNGGGGGNGPGTAGGPQAKPAIARKPSPNGPFAATPTNTRGGVPDYEWTTLVEINDEGAPRFAAAWAPPSKEKPNGLVQIARDFRAIVEVKKFWIEQYPDHLSDKIGRVIEEVYGEVMVARIAHSEQFVSDPAWGHAPVESDLRSPAALTMALLGLVGEDQAIALRVAGLGVRRTPKTS